MTAVFGVFLTTEERPFQEELRGETCQRAGFLLCSVVVFYFNIFTAVFFFLLIYIWYLSNERFNGK